MIDISNKFKTLRIATALAIISLKHETIEIMQKGRIPKGNPLEVAKAAAIQAGKDTSRIILYCHHLPIDFVGVEYFIGTGKIEINVTVKAIAKTGVEMEALTAASVAALTLYDMMKMLDDTMEISCIRLVEKRGGKSDFKDSFSEAPRAAALVISDSVAAGKKEDISGRLIVERLKEEGLEVIAYYVIPDEPKKIEEKIIEWSDSLNLDLVITTGGTGFSLRDTTPEAMKSLFDREIPGIPEAIRCYGQERTPYAMLSRSIAGIRGKTMIVTLPGSRKGVEDSLNILFPGILHAFNMISGGGHN